MSSNTKDNPLIEEFFKKQSWASFPSPQAMIKGWEAFKASCSSEGEGKDWEVESYKCNYLGEMRFFAKQFDQGYQAIVKEIPAGIALVSKRELVANGAIIYRVRRLSDGVVFSVGDEITMGIIAKFEISEGILYGWTSSTWLHLSQLHKVPERKDQQAAKPPLGIISEWLWKEKRLTAIREAIQRYLDAGQGIPINWIAEEYALRNWIENYNEEKQLAQQKIKEG